MTTTQTGLIVTGRTRVDTLLIQSIIDTEGFYAELDTSGSFTFPEEIENYDSLEMTLDKLFGQNGVNARFEGIWPAPDLMDDDNELDPAGGYGLHSHE